MTTPNVPQSEYPDIDTAAPDCWMQPDEDVARMNCGCSLERDHKGDPSFTFCALHAAAPALLAALRAILRESAEADKMYGNKYQDSLFAGVTLEDAHAAIAAAERKKL